jgi:hypothetical protein
MRGIQGIFLSSILPFLRSGAAAAMPALELQPSFRFVGGGATTGRRKGKRARSTVAQDRRRAAKRRAQCRARRLGHA